MKKQDILIRTYSNREHKIVLSRAARLNIISVLLVGAGIVFFSEQFWRYFLFGVMLGLNIFYFFVNLFELSRIYEEEKIRS